MIAAVIGAIAAIAPFLSLVPTAYLVFARTMQHLGWPWYIAAIAALAVELLGVAVSVTGLEAWDWNRRKRKTDPAAPIVLPAILIAVYFVAAELLTVVLDVATGSVTVAKGSQAVFPVLGLAGMFCLAIRYDQAQRVAEVRTTKAETKAARQERTKARQLAESVEVLQQPVIPDAIPDAIINLATKTERVRDLAELHPDWNLMQLATLVHCSVSTASRALATDNVRMKAHKKEIEHVGLGTDQGAI